MNCTRCNKTITILDIFPGGICETCHAKKWDSVPTDKLRKPDFTKSITVIKRKPRGGDKTK